MSLKITIPKSGQPSKEFCEIFDGLVISDAGMRKKNLKSNARCYFTSSNLQFLTWIRQLFINEGFSVGNIATHNPGQSMKKRGNYKAWRFYTHVDPFFTQQYSLWYQDGKKVLKKVVLTPLLIAFWHFGDGCNDGMGSKYNHSRRITLSTESFTVDEVKWLIEQLKKLGIEARPEPVHIPANTRIVFSQAKSVNRFLDLVEMQTPREVLQSYPKKLIRPTVERITFEKVLTPEIKKEFDWDNLDDVEKKWIKQQLSNIRRLDRYHDESDYSNKIKIRVCNAYHEKKSKKT